VTEKKYSVSQKNILCIPTVAYCRGLWTIEEGDRAREAKVEHFMLKAGGGTSVYRIAHLPAAAGSLSGIMRG